MDALGQGTYDRIIGLDIGDIVAIDGCVYVTQRGQLALAVQECTLLTKTLRPPPDRHHGLGDTGTRYRYRELDLLANEETRELFITRRKIVVRDPRVAERTQLHRSRNPRAAVARRRRRLAAVHDPPQRPGP